MITGCLVCVICISKIVHSFIFKLCTMIFSIEDVRQLFCAYLIIFYNILVNGELKHCYVYTTFRDLHYVMCNSNSFHSLLFKPCILISDICGFFYYVQFGYIFHHIVWILNLDIFYVNTMYNLDIVYVRNTYEVPDLYNL